MQLSCSSSNSNVFNHINMNSRLSVLFDGMKLAAMLTYCDVPTAAGRAPWEPLEAACRVLLIDMRPSFCKHVVAFWHD